VLSRVAFEAKFPSLPPFPAAAFVFKTDPTAVARGRRNEFTCWVALQGVVVTMC
jgi:hypothetical protein